MSDQNLEEDVVGGAVNPYALAELITERKLDWDKIESPELVLEEILETPHAELFDPKYESPLYPGLKLDQENNLIPAARSEISRTDFTVGVETPVSDISTVQDLGRFIQTHGDKGLQLQGLGRTLPRNLNVNIDLGKVVPRRLSNLHIPEIFADFVLPGFARDAFEEAAKAKKEWDPPNGYWRDPGHFFNKAANYFDPVQGSVGNCYFIAALASVAWTRPHLIAHRTRSIGNARDEFVSQIRFHKSGSVDSKNSATADVEVTEQILVRRDTDCPPPFDGPDCSPPIYARSSETGEIWPGVYEKAFAKWITGNRTDRPDILATASGSSARAISQLTNEHSRTTLVTRNSSSSELLDLVVRNSRNGKTAHPMTASTYPTADAAPDEITYSYQTVVGSHAYSVLGHVSGGFMAKGSLLPFSISGRSMSYIVLRNPWGSASASASAYTPTMDWEVPHDGWNKNIRIGSNGVFALTVDQFKKYFRSISVVKP